MIYDKDKLRLEYQENIDIWERGSNSIQADIEALLKQKGIKFNKVCGRVKEFESFWTKVRRKEKEGINIKQPLEEVNDIIGVRIVLLYIEDLDEIENILTPTFQILSKERKRETQDDDVFGYDSDHYILRFQNVKGPHYQEFINIKFELQARTILMDAWDSVSHHLNYKNSASIPSNLKKVFFGLSGTFVVADKIFQDLNNESTKYEAEQLELVKNPEKLMKQEINLDTFKAYMRYKFPARWKKAHELLDSHGNDDHSFSILIKQIKNLKKYRTLKDIDNFVDKVVNLGEELSDKRKIQPALVGFFRILLDLYDDDYFMRHEIYVKDVKDPEKEITGYAMYKESLDSLIEYRKRVKK